MALWTRLSTARKNSHDSHRSFLLDPRGIRSRTVASYGEEGKEWRDLGRSGPPGNGQLVLNTSDTTDVIIDCSSRSRERNWTSRSNA